MCYVRLIKSSSFYYTFLLKVSIFLQVVAVLCISISQAQSFCESNTSDGTGLCTSQTLSIGSSRGSPGRPGLASSTRPESYRCVSFCFKIILENTMQLSLWHYSVYPQWNQLSPQNTGLWDAGQVYIYRYHILGKNFDPWHHIW